MTTPSSVEQTASEEEQQTAPVEPGELALPRLLTLSISTRLLVDTTAQIFNPFLSIFAAGLDVSVVTLGQLLGVRSITGLLAPFIGSLADRHGYRRVMRLMLVLIAAGLVLIGSSQRLAQAVAGMVIMGVGLGGFVPTLHAYLSARLPYRVRARGLGMLEYSWALAGIVGLYTMGQLIAVSNWRVPLFVLAGGLLVMWLLLGLLPAAKQRPAVVTGAVVVTQPQPAMKQSTLTRVQTFFDVGVNGRSVYSAIGANMLLFFSGMQLFTTYGAWLNREYQLEAAALGTVALILGCFDLSASISVSLFTDGIGKLRSVTIGAIGIMLGYAALPWLNFSVVGAVIGIILTRTAFEFGIVSQISLMSEQVPSQRAKVMSLSAAFVMLGGTIANVTGPWLYDTQGVWGLSWSSILATGIALFLLLTQINEVNEA